MTRRIFIKVLSAFLAIGSGVAFERESIAQQPPPDASKPNVVVILLDDLGWADIGVQGKSTDVRTPNIDSIGQAGTRFTSGYVSCPVCSPTRAGFITGRYQQRFGHEFNPGPNRPTNFGLPKEQATIADAFKQNGYTTGLIGKWHLGNNDGFLPQDRGFNEFFGFLGGAHKFVGNEQPDSGILRGRTPVGEKEYLTDALGREAAAFIDRNAGKPFFEYVAINDVHTPNQATEKYLSRFPNESDPKRKQLLAKLSAADDAVGAVLAKLREKKVEENTLIFLFTDNGGPTPSNGSRNAPFSGFKGQVAEGGIRVPFLVQWKAKLPQGRVIDHPVIALDIFPTAIAAAGGKLPEGAKLDGKNLLPVLTSESTAAPHEALFWRFGQQWAVRQGSLKLVATRDVPEALYDLASDPGEQRDLSSAQPDDVKRLRELYAAWDKGNVEPLWQGGGGARQQRRQQRQQAGEKTTLAPATAPAANEDAN